MIFDCYYLILKSSWLGSLLCLCGHSSMRCVNINFILIEAGARRVITTNSRHPNIPHREYNYPGPHTSPSEWPKIPPGIRWCLTPDRGGDLLISFKINGQISCMLPKIQGPRWIPAIFSFKDETRKYRTCLRSAGSTQARNIQKTKWVDFDLV